MAPATVGGGCTTRRVRASTRKPRKTQYKKRAVKPKIIQQAAVEYFSDDGSCNSGTTKPHRFSKTDDQDIDDDVSTGCSTPKAERFRIPEIATCPPAPKKPRPAAVSNCSSSLHRSPIAFFASPDIELFFFVALSDASG